MKTASPRRSAFTLIELLIVIGIIAVLAALLLPVFSVVSERGRMTKCESNLRQIYGAFALYANDNNGMLPVVDNWRMASGGSAQQFTVWYTVLAPYLGNYKGQGTKTIFTCPSINNQLKTPETVCYTLNRGVGETPNQQINGTHTARLNQPSKKVLLFDSGSEWTSISYAELGGNGKCGTNPNTTVFTQVHGGKANVLFCDGHVQQCDFTKDLSDPTLWALN